MRNSEICSKEGKAWKGSFVFTIREKNTAG